MDDNTPIPFGIHKGKALANVPANYLLWLYDNGKCYDDLKEYIKKMKLFLDKKMVISLSK